MFEVVLHRPEIPPNTGNVIRLCANTGSRLHLVEPLGFTLDDRNLRRAGLDYHELANVATHVDWDACARVLGERRVFAFSARAQRSFAGIEFRRGDAFVFGGETAGLPEAMLGRFAPERRLRLPMMPGNRSLNLSNSVAVVVFEAWRQIAYEGSA
jgi:tRNA (cytidine/uridine-2'-O-)-methyltransferase